MRWIWQWLQRWWWRRINDHGDDYDVLLCYVVLCCVLLCFYDLSYKSITTKRKTEKKMDK